MLKIYGNEYDIRGTVNYYKHQPTFLVKTESRDLLFLLSETFSAPRKGIMVRSSQDSSSTHASSPYDEHLHSPVRRCIQRKGYPSQISFQFTGTTHIHTAMAMMDAESFSLPPADGFFVMPTHEARPQYLRTRGYPSQISNVIHSPFAGGGNGVRISEYSSPGNNPQPPLSFRYVPFTHVNEFTGVQTPTTGRGSSGAGYHQRTQNAGNIGPAPFLHTDVAGPEYPRDWRYPQPSGVQTPTAGRGSSGAGYHQRTQNAANIGPAPFLHTDVAGPEYPRDWRYPQPSGGLYNGGFTSGAQMDAVRPGSVTGVQTPAVGLGPAVPGPNIGPAPFLHTDVAGPEYPRDWRYPQPSGGLYHGGFTSGAQMDAVRPGSVTGVQTPAVGLGPTGSSGVGYNQLSPIATLGFAGQTSQAPFVPEHDTQAAAPPPTLDQQLFPTSRATAANNTFAEDFLPPAVSDNFMHMLEPRFRV
ncbi:hypothetical protein EZV62_025771 [Acer yangbiense]|uniref:Uncharacterized protein n=1 Tax=Acer yangbiense TaxID=1000413 RepID=A0A5C7H0T5_9ROSI|nr:hypothetical protein EZV62_025771 [Acer yangbiense]